MKDISGVSRSGRCNTSDFCAKINLAELPAVALSGLRTRHDRTLLSLAEDCLAERRGLKFDLCVPGDQITKFTHFVEATGHTASVKTRISLD